MHYLHIGGAESALVQLLDSIDYGRFNVDLFVNSHEGPLMSRIPQEVHLLPENRVWRHIERPMSETLLHGELGVLLSRLKAKLRYSRYKSANPLDEECGLDESVFNFVGDEVVKVLPAISPDKEYDLAVSFMMPHNFVIEKVRAKKYAAWIHTDYSKVRLNKNLVRHVFDSYDYIVAVSSDVASSFRNLFPELAAKVTVVENIVSEKHISGNALAGESVFQEQGLKILSLGRFCHPKNFMLIPEIARSLRNRGLSFQWLIAGPGERKQVDERIGTLGVAECVRTCSGMENPYPTLKDCDIYVQPSHYEGKAVAVEEAKAIGKPVVITPYPTSAAQIKDRYDGLVSSDFSPESVAERILELVEDKKLAATIGSNAARRVASDSQKALNCFENLIGGDCGSERIPRIIHYCWFGGKKLPVSAEKMMETWRKSGFEIKRWDESNFNMSEYPYAVGAYDAGNYAFVSDVCRIHALLNEGGVYMDTDVELVGDLTPYLRDNMFLGFEGRRFVATSVMGAIAGHPLLLRLEKYYKETLYTADATTNVVLLTRILAEKGLRRDGMTQTIDDIHIYPSSVFSPFDYVDGRLRSNGKTVTVHHYSQYWISGNPPLRRRLSVLWHRLIGKKLE